MTPDTQWLDYILESYRLDYKIWEQYGLEDDKDEEDILNTAKQKILAHEAEQVRQAELNNIKALKAYIVGGSATFVDWVNYLDDRITFLTESVK